jgi:imidazole glycerol-phosphate synthase subunit HisH
VHGDVRPLSAGELKLPHIGWNEVAFVERGSELISGLPMRCAFYHVHSFAPVPSSAEDVLGSATYGAPFVTAVQRGSFYGVQFHPEKSSAAGMRLLANFARLCTAPAGQGAVAGQGAAGSAGGSTPR